jgi:hypothetical protein
LRERDREGGERRKGKIKETMGPTFGGGNGGPPGMEGESWNLEEYGK